MGRLATSLAVRDSRPPVFVTRMVALDSGPLGARSPDSLRRHKAVGTSLADQECACASEIAIHLRRELIRLGADASVASLEVLVDELLYRQLTKVSSQEPQNSGRKHGQRSANGFRRRARRCVILRRQGTIHGRERRCRHRDLD